MSKRSLLPRRKKPAARKGAVRSKKAAAAPSSIGTRRESSLHKSLKFRYSGSGETEISAGNYVCDARTGEGELIEVQTGSFAPLREKAASLCRKNKLRIIHPIIAEKRIELFDTAGRLLHRRKSPRKGSLWDLFKALVYTPEFPLIKNLTIELAVIEITEKRVDDGSGSWRRKGIRISDRFLSLWRNSVVLKKPKDYNLFIPFRKNEQFTVRNLREKTGITTSTAQKTLYVLTKTGIVERIGKRGNALVYVISSKPATRYRSRTLNPQNARIKV